MQNTDQNAEHSQQQQQYQGNTDPNSQQFGHYSQQGEVTHQQNQQHMLPPQQSQLLQQGFNQQQMYDPNYQYPQGQDYFTQQGYQHQYHQHEPGYPQFHLQDGQGFTEDLVSLTGCSQDPTGAVPMEYSDGPQTVPQNSQPGMHAEPLHQLNYQAQTAAPQQGVAQSPSGNYNQAYPNSKPQQPFVPNPMYNVPVQSPMSIPYIRQQTQQNQPPGIQPYDQGQGAPAPQHQYQQHYQPAGSHLRQYPYGQHHEYQPKLEEDKQRLHLLNIGPGTSEDTLENFLESCARTEVEGFEWAANKKSVVVAFKTEPDVTAIMNACQRKSIEGHHIEVKTVPRSKCLKVTGLSRDSTEDSVRYYFENKKRGGPIEDMQLFQEKQTAFVRFEQYEAAEKALHCQSPTLRQCALTVSIVPDLPGYMDMPDESDIQVTREKSEVDMEKVLVLNLGTKTSEDTLRNFLESITDSDVSDIKWGQNKTSAIVSFKTAQEIEVVKKKCEGRKVDGQKVEIRTVYKSKCVKVTGLSSDTTEDSVRYYFENKKRGGPVDDVELNQADNTALVRFEQYGVAEKVCSSSHKLREHVLTVTMYTDTPDFVPMGMKGSKGHSTGVSSVTEDDHTECLKLLVIGINQKTSEDTLGNFLEAKANADVMGFEWGQGRTAAIVTFDKTPDVQALQRGCENKKVDGRIVEIHTVCKPKCVKVTGLSSCTTKDSVHYYFENKKRGGPVDDVELDEETNTALVRFEQYGVAEKVCSTSHQLGGQVLTVKMQMDTPGFVPMGENDRSAVGRTPCDKIHEEHVEQLQLLIGNINPLTTEDALRNFFEAKADAEVVNFEWGRGKTAAVITFDTRPDIGKVRKSCKAKQIEKHILTVECVPKSRSLKVTGLADNTTRDSVLYYFENKKKSGGGPIAELMQNRNTATIRFEKDGVAEEVCSRKHKLTGKDITVVFHRDIPGFVSAEDDSEIIDEFSDSHMRESSRLSDTSNQTDIPQWAHIVKDVSLPILRFLNRSEDEKRMLNDHVQRFGARVRFIRQPNGMILEVSSTGNVQAATKNAWIQQVDNAVKKCIEGMDLMVVDIDIPEELQKENINVLLQDRVDVLKVRLYTFQQKIHVVGHRRDVYDAVPSVKEMLISLGPKETDYLEVKTFQMRFLQLSNFLATCNQRYPLVEVHLKSRENKVVLEGPKENLREVKICIHKIFTSLKTDHYTFKTNQAVGILNSTLSDKLEDANISCVWEEESQSTIKLFSEDEEEIKKAKDVIKKTICEEVIKLDKSAAENLKSAEWREARRSLMEQNHGRLIINEDSDVVILAADNDIFQKIISKIDKFFEINTVRRVLLPAEAPKVKFLKDHSAREIRRIQQNFSKEKVSIEFEEGSYSSGVKISGLNEGIAKAKKEVEKLLDKVKHKDIKLTVPGINYFFKKGKGREFVTGIEQDTHTVIRPKERQTKKKSVKSWTTSAGVVSVVKGDMCQLRVDAIVFTANKDLKLVGGLGKAIVEKGGKEIQEEADKHMKRKGQLSAGTVISTGSGKLRCKSVIHAVLPKWNGPSSGNQDCLKTTVVNILKECNKKHVKSVAVPALGTGQGYPLLDAVKVIVETLHEQWGEGEGSCVQEVILCDIKQATVTQFVKTCDSVFAGARPRHQIEEEDEDDHTDDQSESGSESDSGDAVSGSEEAPRGIQVIVGELSEQKADVLVNPTGKELNMSVGAVSKSLLEAGGPAIQAECKEKYSAGLKVGQIAVTTGGKLRCRIFHGILQQWNQGRDDSELTLKKLVLKCLKEADVQGLKSIAFPALGTGKVGFPADVSADIMFQAAKGFLEDNHETSVKTISFVMHHKDMAVKKAFESKQYSQGSDHRRYTGTRQGQASSYRYTGGNQDKPDKGDYSGPYKRGSVKVDILKGDLTKEKTDCIVSCSDESFELKRGALSKAILAQAGPNLQDECSSKKDDLVTNGLTVTNGYNLSCKNIIHLKVQKSPRDWGTLLVECFEKAESMGMKSLSLPALGTGGQRMSPEKMASSLLYAVNKFADRHSHSTLTLMRVVIFQGPMVSTYKTVFAGGKPRSDGHAGQHHQNRGEHSSGPRGQSRPQMKEEDHITLCIFSCSKDSIDKAKDRIQELCRDEFDEKHISREWATKIENLDDDEMSHLYDIARKHRVVLTRNKSELVLTGRVKDVSEVKDQILSKFRDDTMTQHMKEEARMVAKLVQWSYGAQDSSKHFTVGLNCRLEKAYTAKEKTIEIKDPKGRAYTVDFKKMTEFPKGGGKPIKIMRLEKAIRAGLSKMVKGEKEALAGTKTVYFTLQAERSFKGNAEDLHFRTAESQFYRLLGAASAQFAVTKVEYVVNPGLIKKFRTAQANIKAKRGADPSEPVLAFHGTNETYIKSICEGGFKKPGDQGFAAKTDSGYYGSGVYFSEFPAYAMGYINGAQKLLLSQVIQGKVYQCTTLMNGAPLQAGYDSHTSPDGKELIIFDTACILPCYIVHFGKSSGDFAYQ